jgi:hypothetical protein
LIGYFVKTETFIVTWVTIGTSSTKAKHDQVPLLPAQPKPAEPEPNMQANTSAIPKIMDAQPIYVLAIVPGQAKKSFATQCV